MLNLKDYLPSYYDGVREMQRLMEAEQKMGDRFGDLSERLLLNQFVMQADSEGLALFEFQLGLPTDYTKSLDSRQYDVLMRILPPRPITFKYFQSLIKSFNIPANVQRDVQEQAISTFSERDDITDIQLDWLKYLLNVYLPVNMAYQININSEARSELPMNLNSVTQLFSETTVRPKEV